MPLCASSCLIRAAKAIPHPGKRHRTSAERQRRQCYKRSLTLGCSVADPIAVAIQQLLHPLLKSPTKAFNVQGVVDLLDYRLQACRKRLWSLSPRRTSKSRTRRSTSSSRAVGAGALWPGRPISSARVLSILTAVNLASRLVLLCRTCKARLARAFAFALAVSITPTQQSKQMKKSARKP